MEQYGLLKNLDDNAVVTNNIYKTMFTRVFFKEVSAYREVPLQEYQLPGDGLDMEKVLLNFEHYISQIGVNAFYKEKKPYEKTGQFLLTAWLYQFTGGGAGELRYEIPSGFGRMDILLSYRGRKYIIETKINRHNLTRTINDGVAQVSKKYLASEAVEKDYLVVFDLQTKVGEECKPVHHHDGDKKVTSFTIGIGRPKL